MASAHLAKTSSDVVTRLVEISGTAPIHTDHPLQLLLGDALVPKQHAFLGPAMYVAAGAVLMGLPPTTPGFRWTGPRQGEGPGHSGSIGNCPAHTARPVRL